MTDNLPNKEGGLVKKANESPFKGNPKGTVKFEVYGDEMVEKEVKQSGNSGRVYLPPYWINRRVKIIRID